ncbi:peptidase M20/M25/M40 family protein [Burkholderia humptydooensis]|nr:peptidase M20/M25/M40 family protein [Burkholderia sp. 2002721687]
MDALPVHEANDFAHRSTVPGTVHACGHDGHNAMLLVAAQHLAAHDAFDGTVHFIFRPAEEAGGGARAERRAARARVRQGAHGRRCGYFFSVRYDTRSLIGPISGPVTPGRVATCTTFSNRITNGEFASTAFCSA